MRPRGGTNRFVKPVYATTNPATNAATSADIVDAYAGALITLTGPGNPQTLGTPSNPVPNRQFIVLNDDTSTDSITVEGIEIDPGESLSFVWDGSAWLTEVDESAGGGGTLDRWFSQEFNESPNGVRTTFTTSQDFKHGGTDTEIVYYSGQALIEGAGNDYVAFESGGGGSGYDSITMAVPPKSFSTLRIDFTPDV